MACKSPSIYSVSEEEIWGDNTGIIQGILLENDINSLSSDIETETLSKVAVHGEVINY